MNEISLVYSLSYPDFFWSLIADSYLYIYSLFKAIACLKWKNDEISEFGENELLKILKRLFRGSHLKNSLKRIYLNEIWKYKSFKTYETLINAYYIIIWYLHGLYKL